MYLFCLLQQMANICIFLRSCRNLGLGESILFETVGSPRLYFLFLYRNLLLCAVCADFFFARCRHFAEGKVWQFFPVKREHLVGSGRCCVIVRRASSTIDFWDTKKVDRDEIGGQRGVRGRVYEGDEVGASESWREMVDGCYGRAIRYTAVYFACKTE